MVLEVCMGHILFVDTEVSLDGKKLKDIGAIKDENKIFHGKSTEEFTKFAEKCTLVIGHNIFQHDLKYISPYLGCLITPVFKLSQTSLIVVPPK